MPDWAIVTVVFAACTLGVGVGWFVIGPFVSGYKPFTTTAQASRGERRLKRG